MHLIKIDLCHIIELDAPNISKTKTDWMNNGEILDDSAYSLECNAPFIDVLLLPEQ